MHIEKRPSTLAPTEVLNEGVRTKLVSRVFLLFDINVNQKRKPWKRGYTRSELDERNSR